MARFGFLTFVGLVRFGSKLVLSVRFLSCFQEESKVVRNLDCIHHMPAITSKYSLYRAAVKREPAFVIVNRLRLCIEYCNNVKKEKKYLFIQLINNLIVSLSLIIGVHS